LRKHCKMLFDAQVNTQFDKNILFIKWCYGIYRQLHALFMMGPELSWPSMLIIMLIVLNTVLRTYLTVYDLDKLPIRICTKLNQLPINLDIKSTTSQFQHRISIDHFLTLIQYFDRLSLNRVQYLLYKKKSYRHQLKNTILN